MGVLGKLDQMLIDNGIVSEVKEPQTNLVVAYSNSQKAYYNVHHDWMTIVCRRMCFPERVVHVTEQLMCGWKTRLEVTAHGSTADG